MNRTRVTVGVVAGGVGVLVPIIALAGAGAASRGRASSSFSWLRPASAPIGWSVARTQSGASLAYPPGWTPIKTEPGTASVALLGNRDRSGGLHTPSCARSDGQDRL